MNCRDNVGLFANDFWEPSLRIQFTGVPGEVAVIGMDSEPAPAPAPPPLGPM